MIPSHDKTNVKVQLDEVDFRMNFLPFHAGKCGRSWMRNETSLTRSAMGEFANDSFQHREIASKWAGSNVCDQLSTARRISSWGRYQHDPGDIMSWLIPPFRRPKLP